MFRKPREHQSSTPFKPSTGRPPTPPRSFKSTPNSSRLTTSSKPVMAFRSSVSKSQKNSTLKSSSLNNGRKTSAWSGDKPKSRPNKTILNFFKRTEMPVASNKGLFLPDTNSGRNNKDLSTSRSPSPESIFGESEDLLENANGYKRQEEYGSRFNENREGNKRRRLSPSGKQPMLDDAHGIVGSDTPIPTKVASQVCTPLPQNIENYKENVATNLPTKKKNLRKTGPFIQDSDSEDEEADEERSGLLLHEVLGNIHHDDGPIFTDAAASTIVTKELRKDPGPHLTSPIWTPAISHTVEDGDFNGCLDIGDDEALQFLDEAKDEERRWMKKQPSLEVDEDDEDIDDSDRNVVPKAEGGEICQALEGTPSCPICNISLEGIPDSNASIHVNNCLDGNPSPLPPKSMPSPQRVDTPTKARGLSNIMSSELETRGPPKLSQADRTAISRLGQANPSGLITSKTQASSAFTKLMSGHAEDSAWADAASAETASRGKPAYKRTCPFYKIMPGLFICVDAFRYGAVQGCNAYFLSHFHSDHYIGLSSKWCHGSIYCSRATANLVKQQLKVDPRWVVSLNFDETVDVPGTGGVRVTMIPANHCPGSSLYLFEKAMGEGKNPRVQRVLHCGDFRACRAHVKHHLLEPNVMDSVSGKTREQKIDVCYLDTTYLNPKYAFPSQGDVITSCVDMCVSMSKDCVDESDNWGQTKRERAGNVMTRFIKNSSAPILKTTSSSSSANNSCGRLLVVIGTYSIGKERLCIGVAKALNSKIFAPAAKQKICGCLEDPELMSLLTSDPLEAQVHMQMIMEIRPETLQEYLNGYKPHFSRIVGFRPSGWNYRPPNSRSLESPSISSVLHGENWRSKYTIHSLNPQRGSTREASCFGVPYSEHSSFRELTMFCCALRIDKVIPTVNVGSAKSREMMKGWIDRWTMERRKNGVFRVGEGEGEGKW